jgi:UDP-N-acetylmuramyl pentapeptide synthase
MGGLITVLAKFLKITNISEFCEENDIENEQAVRLLKQGKPKNRFKSGSNTKEIAEKLERDGYIKINKG